MSAVATARAAAAGSAMGFLARLRRYFEDAYAEMLRVTWPTRQVVTRGTIVVIAVIVVMSLYVLAIATIISRVSAPLLK